MMHKPTVRIQLDDAGNDQSTKSIEKRMGSFDAFSISPTGVACLKSPSRLLSKPPPHSPKHSQEALLILNEIGRGSTARVYKCIYVPALMPVAVKSIHIGGEKGQENALNELKALFTINKSQFRWKKQTIKAPCPYIISFFDAYTDPDYENVCLVLEYMGGGTLQNLTDILFSSRWPRDGDATGEYSGSRSCNNEDDVLNSVMRLDSSSFVEGERAVAVVAYSVLRALEVLHTNNIMHRDVKPSNILVNADGEVKLSDFGCFKEFDQDKSCHTFKGTITFMAPERLTNQGYGPSSDVWGLGICLYRFLMGTSPFPRARTYWNLVDTMIEGQRDVLPPARYSRYLRDFVRQCLLLDSKKRPSASLLLIHPFLLQAIEDGVIVPPTQPTLKGLVPIHPQSEPPENVQEIVRRVLEWEPEHADEMVLWPRAEEKSEEEGSSDVAATALKRSGDEEGDVRKKQDVDDLCQEGDNCSEDWPANLAGKNGCKLAATAARRLAKALNVEASLVESCVAERLTDMTKKGYSPPPSLPRHVASSVGLSSELEALIATQGGRDTSNASMLLSDNKYKV